MDFVPKVEVLKESLGWPDIREHLGDENEYANVSIFPTEEAGNSIFILMGPKREFGGCVGFGGWHYHPDSWEDAEPTIVAILCGELGVIEGLNGRGQYRQGSLGRKGDWPETLGRDIKSLRLVFFDEPPESVAIDFTKYYQGKHLWVRKDVKQRSEKFCREYGMEIPEF